MDVLDLLDFLGDSDDEPAVPAPPARVFKDHTNPFDEYDDSKFRIRYRFDKPTVYQMIEILKDRLPHRAQRSYTVSPATQVFLTLRFMATGSVQRDTGDFHGVDQSTVSRKIHTVLEAMASLSTSFIQFPDPDEFERISQAFYEKRGFPGVIGAIDGTHVPILNPGGTDSELFRNRKGWFSLNVQIVCDDRMIIRNIVASHYGSVHDARIFYQSGLKDRLEAIPRKYHLLGDRGYGCNRYMMVPLANPKTAPERRYNFAHSSTRMVIERVNGVLKRRFPCLSKTLNYKPEKCGVIIVACAVLHNIAMMKGDEEPYEDIDFSDGDQRPPGDDPSDNQGIAKRRAIIANYFS